MIKCIVLNNSILISTIEETPSELGEPDCKLTNPFSIIKTESGCVLEPWLSDYTNQNSFMISSDKIITIAEPNETILSKYNSLIK